MAARWLSPAAWAVRWQRWRSGRVALDDTLWQPVMEGIPFLQGLSDAERVRLKRLSEAFLAQKRFFGLQELTITDEMAVAIAAQACLPLLHWGPPDRPEQALRWYEGCHTVVLAPGEVPVTHQWQDEAGVQHEGVMLVSGEMHEDGPVLLSWPDVLAGMGRPSADWLACREAQGDGLWSSDSPYNVVIHEFCHKIDMRNGEADGCPPLPAGFMGQSHAGKARALWRAGLQAAFEAHAEQVAAAERFGASPPWLDAYGATDLAEFFPVVCEAYFTQPKRLSQAHPALHQLLDALFRPTTA